MTLTPSSGALKGGHVTAQVAAYTSIRDGIISGALPPGSKLNQNELAEQLQLSTTPIREALRRLAGDGLVQIDSYRGAMVYQLDRDELTEIYETRMLLEPAAIQRAIVRLTDADFLSAERLYERMEVEDDPRDWVEANREFHTILESTGKSLVLEPILNSLRDRAAPYVRLSLALDSEAQGRTNAEHREILDAYRDSDVDRAIELQVAHLRGTLELILSNMKPLA